jgi:ParB family chromosome partitioning protein
MKKKDTGLGRGLGALIPSVQFEKDDNGFDRPKKDEVFSTTIEIPIDQIVRNPYQPRKSFEQSALAELKDSIQLHGVIQPITVRKVARGYELIAGERRLRASQLAGLETVPANIMSVESSQKMLELALIENIQRYDLNPIEEAMAYKQLLDECGLTQEQVARQVSKERSTVTNLLRLLRLPDSAQEALKNGGISLGHAKVLLGLNDNDVISDLVSKIISEKLSVRQLNDKIKSLKDKPKKEKPEIKDIDPFVKAVEKQLRDGYATDVRIKLKENNSGSIEIKFYSESDLNRILQIMENSDS